MDENKANQGIESFRKNLIEVHGFREKYKDAEGPPNPAKFAKELARINRGRWAYSSKKRKWMVFDPHGKSSGKFEKVDYELMEHAVFIELEARGLDIWRTNALMRKILRCLKHELYDVFS